MSDRAPSRPGARADEAIVHTLTVQLEGMDQPVGMLHGLIGRGGHRIRFTYIPGYRGPALSCSLKPRDEPYGDREARTYFDNLLPEGAARRDVVDGSGRPFDEDDVAGLLSVIGGECPGAVMVVPPGAPSPKVPGDLRSDYDLLTDHELAETLRGLAAGLAPDDLVRASLPGVQPKLAVAYDADSDTFMRPRIYGVPTTHLLKVAPAREPRFAGVIGNEMLCMRIAARLGLPVAEMQRLTFDDVEALAVRRYDRTIAADKIVRRLHQEDAAQALGLDRTLKYENKARAAGRAAGLAELLGPFSGFTIAPAETRDVLRRAVFANWLLGNNDAHMKNFSLLHSADGGQPTLAPLYDIVSVEALPGRWTEMAMRMHGTEVAAAVRRPDIEWLAAYDGGDRRPPGTVLRRRLGAFRDMAAAVLPGIADVVQAEDASEDEAAPIESVVRSRLAILQREFGWNLA